MTTEMVTQNVLPAEAGSRVEGEAWFVNLVDECQDIVVETEFTSRWVLVEGYHQLGKRILAENDNFERAKIYGTEILQRIAKCLGKNTRTLYYAVQFARAYPDLSLLKEGKNISWHHVINKYLTDGKEKMKKADLAKMIKEIKQLLQTEWLKENQLVVSGEVAINKSNCGFISYLQDMVEKITGRSRG